MAKYADDSIMDAGLNVVKNNYSELYVTAGQPANRAAAISAALATMTGLDNTDVTGPANGDVSGRKLTINAQTGLTIDVSGTADHIAICSGSLLLYVTTISNSQVLTMGGTVDVGAWDIEIADPV